MALGPGGFKFRHHSGPIGGRSILAQLEFSLYFFDPDFYSYNGLQESLIVGGHPRRLVSAFVFLREALDDAFDSGRVIESLGAPINVSHCVIPCWHARCEVPGGRYVGMRPLEEDHDVRPI